MTVQKDVTKNIYVGNSSTRTFPFTFECPAEHPEYIKVYLMQDDGTALATSDYQLDMDAKQITYPSSGTALPEGKKLVIMRELPLQQMMNLVNNGPYFAEDIETAFDECVMAMQQIAEKLNRSIIMSVDIDGDAFVNEVPFEAGKSFRISDDGKSIVLTEDPARVLPLAQGVYAQAQAQAQSAAASATAAAKSENNAAASANAASNSAQSASASATSAAESVELTSGYKQEALTAKADAATSATNAKASENNAEASNEAAQSAARNANNFATSASSSASEAKSYRDSANNYAAIAKNYSENVNVFTPSVSTSGVLSWTNKAGLANPPSVNIKGEKGDQGLQGIQGVQGVKGDTGAKGDRGATGAAATIRIGTVTTGASGSEAVVTNVGTANDAVFNFRLPRGEKGADGGIDIDAELSDTSTNPVQNKVIKNALDDKVNKTGIVLRARGDDEGNNIRETYVQKGTATNLISNNNEFNFVSKKGVKSDGLIYINYRLEDGVWATSSNLINEYRFYKGNGGNTLAAIRASSFIGNADSATKATQDGDGKVISTTYAKSSAANTWEEQQDFKEVKLEYEKYLSRKISNTGGKPSVSLMQYEATGAFTLNLSRFSTGLQINESTVFTAYITSSADHPLTITNAGTIKYIGSASDVAITSAGLLLNILMMKDESDTVTSIVQASKLEGGA